MKVSTKLAWQPKKTQLTRLILTLRLPNVGTAISPGWETLIKNDIKSRNLIFLSFKFLHWPWVRVHIIKRAAKKMFKWISELCTFRLQDLEIILTYYRGFLFCSYLDLIENRKWILLTTTPWLCWKWKMFSFLFALSCPWEKIHYMSRRECIWKAFIYQPIEVLVEGHNSSLIWLLWAEQTPL